MGKITAITRQTKNKNRVSLFVDGQYLGGLDEKTFLLGALKTGDELTDEKWQELSVMGENQSAFNKAISYISRAMRSQKQVTDYLAKKGFEQTAIDYAVGKMREYNYIADEVFADAILSHQINVKHAGVLAVRQAMRQSGIDKDTTEKAIAKYGEESQQENANLLAEKLKTQYRNTQDEREKKRKISQAMQRRGFSWDIINRALNITDDMS